MIALQKRLDLSMHFLCLLTPVRKEWPQRAQTSPAAASGLRHHVHAREVKWLTLTSLEEASLAVMLRAQPSTRAQKLPYGVRL